MRIYTGLREKLISSDLLLSNQIRCTHVNNVSATRKNTFGLLAMMKDELDYNDTALHVVNIGVCSDASGESRAARICLLDEMPHLLIVDCYAHQVMHTSLAFHIVYMLILLFRSSLLSVITSKETQLFHPTYNKQPRLSPGSTATPLHWCCFPVSRR